MAGVGPGGGSDALTQACGRATMWARLVPPAEQPAKTPMQGQSQGRQSHHPHTRCLPHPGTARLQMGENLQLVKADGHATSQETFKKYLQVCLSFLFALLLLKINGIWRDCQKYL